MSYEIVQAEVAPFTKGAAMSTPLDDMSINQMVLAYKLADFVEKAVKARKEALRTEILAWTEQHGELTEKAGYVADVAGFRVTNEARRSTSPDPEGIKAMLEAQALGVDEAFDTVKVLQLSPSKVKFLVESGKLDEDAVEELHKVTRALRVQEPKEMRPVLNEAKAP